MKDHSSRPVLENSSQDPISKITRAKWTGGVAQVLEHLLCKCEALGPNHNHTHPPTKRMVDKKFVKEIS
jgi:hypothetical protein